MFQVQENTTHLQTARPKRLPSDKLTLFNTPPAGGQCSPHHLCTMTQTVTPSGQVEYGGSLMHLMVLSPIWCACCVLALTALHNQRFGATHR